MNQVPVAVNTLFFIPFSRIYNGFMGKHCPAFVRYIEYVPVAFHTLGVFKRFIGLGTIFIPVVGAIDKMDKYILNAMGGFGVKEIDHILGRRQVAIHAVGRKPLGVIDMG